jgi:spermidine synthase
MLSQKDEFVYHEMIAHVPMCTNPKIKNVLVIGAGDGGVIRELSRHDNIQHIDMIEIDEMVCRVCIEYFPEISNKLVNNPKLSLRHIDGIK